MKKHGYGKLQAIVIAGALFASGCFCAACAVEPSAKSVNFIGYASFAFGQIVKGQWEYGNAPYDHYWSHHVYAGVGFNARMSDNFEITTRVEGKMWNAFPSDTKRPWLLRNYSMWLDQAKMTYGFGGLEKPVFSITAGYFVYKYNPEVRDLGEFLFRSLTYPGFLINYFDFPAARLLGFKFSADLFEGSLKQDLFLHEECENYPFGNISVGYIASYNIMKVVEIGAGFDLCRLFDINTESTTPGTTNLPQPRPENAYILGFDSTGAVIQDFNSYYTFKANKVMGRMTIDPKPLFGSLGEIFGAEDLKLYGEIAVIGLKNHPFYYDDIHKRMPAMFGMNLPAFKFLDHLAVEFEHYALPFSTNMGKVLDQGLPLPNDGGSSWNRWKWGSDDWKWAVHLKKTVIQGLDFTLQLSRDHFRGYWSDGLPAYCESLVMPGDWSWTAKITGGL
jgi:hypothetical protein